MSQMRLGVRHWRERGTKGERVPRPGWAPARKLAKESDITPLTKVKHEYYIPNQARTSYLRPNQERWNIRPWRNPKESHESHKPT